MWNTEFSHWTMMNWEGGWPWFMGFHGILWLLFLFLMLLAVVHLVRDWRRNPTAEAALAALAQEYARGRIERDEYLRRKRDLA